MTRVARPSHFATLIWLIRIPLGWPARVFGWRAYLKWPAMALAAATLATLSWRQTSLRDLPDIGDPFDVAAFQAIDVPESRNAYVLYDRAIRATRGLGLDFRGPIQISPIPALVSENDEALRLWREGTERPDAIDPLGNSAYQFPKNFTSAGLPVLAQLALAKAAGSEAVGDMAGAWGWYRAVLRSSRHVGMHGHLRHRERGSAILTFADKPIRRWAADPRVDGPLLRRALAEARAIDAMTAPASDALKRQYFIDLEMLEWHEAVWPSQPPDRRLGPVLQMLPVFPRFRSYLMREPDRSRRLIRLIYANRLAYADRPRAARPTLGGAVTGLYDLADDPNAPASVRAFDLPNFLTWFNSSLLPVSPFQTSWGRMRVLNTEEPVRADLLIELASECYRRDHGQRPESPQALVGPYLDRLPDDFEPPEPASKP